MVTLTKHVILGPDLHSGFTLALIGDFCNIFLPNVSEDKKSPTICALGPGTVPSGKHGAGYCITFMKRLGDGLR